MQRGIVTWQINMLVSSKTNHIWHSSYVPKNVIQKVLHVEKKKGEKEMFNASSRAK